MLLLIAHVLLLTAHRSLLIAHVLLLTAHRSLLVAHKIAPLAKVAGAAEN
jgi:hypothetical protein